MSGFWLLGGLENGYFGANLSGLEGNVGLSEGDFEGSKWIFLAVLEGFERRLESALGGFKTGSRRVQDTKIDCRKEGVEGTRD